MVYTKRRIRNSKKTISYSRKNTRIKGGMFSRPSAGFSKSNLPVSTPTRRPSLNMPPENINEELKVKTDEVIAIINELNPILDNAAKELETYNKIKEDLQDMVVTLNNDVKISKKQTLEDKKKTCEENIVKLFESYSQVVINAKEQIAKARATYPKIQNLDLMLNYYINPHGNYANTITHLREVYISVNNENTELEKNPDLNDTITTILEYKEGTYKDKIMDMIEKTKEYTADDKIYVYGRLIYYLMVRIKLSKDEEFSKKLVPFVTEEIFMKRKAYLNEILEELKDSSDPYPSLEKVFDLLTLPENIDKQSVPVENI
jgi:hypothetical protein